MALSNTQTRIIVSVVSIPVILLLSYYGKEYFLFFVLAISGISYYEFSDMAKAKSAKANLVLGIPGLFFLLLNQYSYFLNSYIFFTGWIILVLIYELFRNNGSAILNIGVTLLGVLYLGLFGSALINIRQFYPYISNLYQQGGFLIISIFATIWICDSAAFFGGTSLGKHKLFPRVSPKKSWEGAIFGFVFAILTMIVAKEVVLDFLTFTNVTILGIIIGFFGQLGDLVESLLKRDAEVKDSSNLIPGHGGIFDRFDSLFFSAPVIYIYLNYFA